MCELCPVVGGAMKATTCGKWCHMICALWCPDPIGLNGGLLEGLSEVRIAQPSHCMGNLTSGQGTWQAPSRFVLEQSAAMRSAAQYLRYSACGSLPIGCQRRVMKWAPTSRCSA